MTIFGRTLEGWLIRIIYGPDAGIMRASLLRDLMDDLYLDGLIEGERRYYCQEPCCSSRAYQSADGTVRPYDG